MYVIACPLGLILGAVVSEHTVELAIIIFQSFATGTMVYIGCVDLIVDEFFQPETL